MALCPSPLSQEFLATRAQSHGDDPKINWSKLLASDPDDETPSLDLNRSDLESWTSNTPEDLTYSRTWDIDSFIAPTEYLEVHVNGFNLAYRPPYTRRIVQNQKVRHRGHEFHKLKNLRLGQGGQCRNLGFHTYVCFPNMPLGRDGITHPTDSQQSEWYDLIILPALRRRLPAHILQHHPRSFREIKARSTVRAEESPLSSSQPIDVVGFVPAEYLGEVWLDIKQAAQTIPQFMGLFLVIIGHDLKLHTRDVRGDVARIRFLENLRSWFHMERPYLDPENIWIDFGYEDTPIATTDECFTLIRKTSCLQDWTQKFKCPESDGKLQAQEYRWAMTRDAGSASVDLGLTNAWHSKGGLMHAKSYNLHKDLFATPAKGVRPFELDALEGLGYSQEVLNRWYECNKRGSTDWRKREQLIKAYKLIKSRIAAVLEDTAKTNFGVRSEYRMSIGLLNHTELLIPSGEQSCRVRSQMSLPLGRSHLSAQDDPGSDSSSSSQSATSSKSGAEVGPKPTRVHFARVGSSVRHASQSTQRSGLTDTDRSEDNHPANSLIAMNNPGNIHRNFWIFRTRDVNQYLAAECSRWLLLLEALITQVERGVGGLMPASPEMQMVNGVMVSTLVRTLRMTLSGCDPTASPSLWRHRWNARRYHSSHDADEAEPAPTHRLGLDYKQSLQDYGMVWLQRDLILWEALPMFTPRAVKTLHVARNGFQRSLKRTPNIQARLVRENTLLNGFRDHAKQLRGDHARPPFQNVDASRRRKELFRLGAQLIISQFIRDLWVHLAARAHPDIRNESSRTGIFTQPLSQEEREGFKGITYDMIEKLISATPYIALARGTARNGRSMFERYNTGEWVARVGGLFGIDDLPSDARMKRSWENMRYRRLSRQLRSIIQQTWDVDTAAKFIPSVSYHAAQFLWLIPQYELDKFSSMAKPSKHNSKSTQEALRESSPMERTKWLLPQLESKHFLDCRRLENCMRSGATSNSLSEEDTQAKARLQMAYRSTKQMRLLMQETSGNNYPLEGVPWEPEYFGLNLHLRVAKEFLEELREGDTTDSSDTDHDNSSPSD